VEVAGARQDVDVRIEIVQSAGQLRQAIQCVLSVQRCKIYSRNIASSRSMT
jgi:hypothetical protein